MLLAAASLSSAIDLEAALWAFYHNRSYREGCLLAVNLGDDADTTGAIYGQLADALYGEAGIPADWLAKLAAADLIGHLAGQLYELAEKRGQSGHMSST
jgi:ADP-ribosyl-[dinitrogen reductase] hydrolase